MVVWKQSKENGCTQSGTQIVGVGERLLLAALFSSCAQWDTHVMSFVRHVTLPNKNAQVHLLECQSRYRWKM